MVCSIMLTITGFFDKIYLWLKRNVGFAELNSILKSSMQKRDGVSIVLLNAVQKGNIKVNGLNVIIAVKKFGGRLKILGDQKEKSFSVAWPVIVLGKTRMFALVLTHRIGLPENMFIVN